jgi:hypothetical protein
MALMLAEQGALVLVELLMLPEVVGLLDRKEHVDQAFSYLAAALLLLVLADPLVIQGLTLIPATMVFYMGAVVAEVVAVVAAVVEQLNTLMLPLFPVLSL